MAFLRVVKGLKPGQTFPLESECFVLGRHPESHLVLTHGAVQRRHAQIVKIDNQYYLEDFCSRNGTFLNEERIEGRRLLSDGDEVRICEMVFVFQHEHLPESPAGSSGAEVLPMEAGDDTSCSTQATAEAKLQAILDISGNLRCSVGWNDVLPKVLDSLLEIFIEADRGFIFLEDRQTGSLVPTAVKHRHDSAAEPVRISRTIVNRVMVSKQAVLSADATPDGGFDMSEGIADFRLRSVMCAPLIDGEGRAMGVVQIDTAGPGHRFDDEDLDVFLSVAYHVSLVVENFQLHEIVLESRMLERDLAVAAEIQKGFSPAEPPRLDGYGFSGSCEQSGCLGGDYFDYVPLPDNRWAIVLADVAGQGVTAALVAAALWAQARHIIPYEPTPAAAIRRLNRAVCDSRWEARFVTLILAVLDPLRHAVTIVNAGHIPPLLRHCTGEVEEVGEATQGLPLGIIAETEYQEYSVDLAIGDTMILYSDGISEAINPESEFYGTGRLRNLIGQPVDDVDALVRRIVEDVKGFMGSRGLSDDICCVCFGRPECRSGSPRPTV